MFQYHLQDESISILCFSSPRYLVNIKISNFDISDRSYQLDGLLQSKCERVVRSDFAAGCCCALLRLEACCHSNALFQNSCCLDSGADRPIHIFFCCAKPKSVNKTRKDLTFTGCNVKLYSAELSKGNSTEFLHCRNFCNVNKNGQIVFGRFYL